MPKLTPNQKRLRLRLIEICHERHLSHLGSCLSALDLIDTIYKVKKDSNRFILSNGHAALALYVVLEKYGYLKNNEIHKLMIHPDRNTKLGIDASTGSLGQGLPIAVGMALADRKNKVFCMLSDGECSEGSIWESLGLISNLKLNNLKLVINYNGWSGYDKVSRIPLVKKLSAYGFRVVEIDFGRLRQVIKYLKSTVKGLPQIIFAMTSVEQLPFLKGLDAHYHVMTEEEFNLARKIFK